IDVGQAEADNVIVQVPLAVGVVAQHPAGSPPAAERVALVPDEHRGPVAVEHHVARIEVALEHAAAQVGRDDHTDSRQFLVAEMADLASRLGHKQTLTTYACPNAKPGCPSCSSATVETRKLLIFPVGRWLSFADCGRQLR